MIDHADLDALVERASGGDADAFRALYEEFAPRLYRFTLFRVRDASDAEDLVQRVFVKMIEALPRYEQRGLPFGAWVFRMMRNAIIDFERTRRPHDDLEIAAALLGSGPGPEELAELAVEREQLIAALQFLTAEQRDVVTLRFFGGLSPGEIGSLIGKREGSVRALQFRALETLRRELTKAEPAMAAAARGGGSARQRPGEAAGESDPAADVARTRTRTGPRGVALLRRATGETATATLPAGSSSGWREPDDAGEAERQHDGTLVGALGRSALVTAFEPGAKAFDA
jgi:RNA polymerase sigma-70 factor (ECF subfamily)